MRGRIGTAWLAAAVLAVPAAAQEAEVPAPRPGEPPISAQTQRSGGVRPAEQAGLRLKHADLALELFPDAHRIAGVATLRLTSERPVSRLLIDLDTNLPVSAVSIDGRPLAAGSWSNAEGQLSIPLRRPLASGREVTARIAYAGTPHVAVRAPWDDGIVWARTPSGAPWVGTTSEGFGCDLYWPCLDFPRGEAEAVDLHITVPEGLKAPANGALQGVETLADGRTTWHWRSRSPNPYSLALNVAPYAEIGAEYHSRFGNSFPIRFWHLPEHAAQARRLFDAEFAPTIDFFETVVGPYPWSDEKLGVVETPYLGMEHQTINAYGNGYRATPHGFDDLFQHELAHEWFGNQVTAANWDDYWIHEGYAAYMQPLYGRWREGDARYAVMMDELRRGIANRAPIVSGEVRTEEEVYREETGGPGGDIYSKAAWVLHTLRHTIGDDAFWEATRRLVYGRPDPQPGNFAPRFGSTEDYVAIVNQVTGTDYGWFFDVYLRQAELPELISERRGDRLLLKWRAPANLPFPLPVEVQIDDRIERLAMTGGSGSIAVPEGAHVVIDPHAKLLRHSPALERLRQQRQAGGQ
ncbi:M1 family metallopeptidase [Sphingosinithalassobacter sp. LHW66-3]|uniref:M1 family metallopeptidase n=1 Tax=Sphingosinithalassobacter sp. LHW66-3 TaxID=3424718 RepID=UPI003D69FEA9